MRELSLHILDIVQNAVEAGATRVTLSVAEDFAADTLTIQVSDNGRGMDEQTVARVLDPFYTTRTTRRVGLGLPLLAAATQRCNGRLTIRSQVGVGTTVTATFQHSHIDRAPLGNMPTTLLSILLSPATDKAEGLAFTYEHRVRDAEGQERAFRFSTAELRRELGDIPFSYGPVVQWLREFLAENLAALYVPEKR